MKATVDEVNSKAINAISSRVEIGAICAYDIPCKLNNISAPLSQKKRKKGAPVRPGRICRILAEVKIGWQEEENADIL